MQAGFQTLDGPLSNIHPLAKLLREFLLKLALLICQLVLTDFKSCAGHFKAVQTWLMKCQAVHSYLVFQLQAAYAQENDNHTSCATG